MCFFFSLLPDVSSYAARIGHNADSLDVVNTAIGCDFYVYDIHKLANGGYEFCVKTLNPSSFANFLLWDQGVLVNQTTDPIFCYTTSTPYITIQQTNTDSTYCTLSTVFTLDEECPRLSNITVDNCTKNISFDLNLKYKAYLDFGDGSVIEVFDWLGSLNVSHQYSNNVLYNVCITYDNGETMQYCCYPIDLSMCTNSEFTPVIDTLSTSCLKPLYHEIPYCGRSSCESIWEYEDGTVYYGHTRPSHYFTNFVNADDSVWIKHTVICCNDTSVTVKKVPHKNAAFIGTPGVITNLSDTIQWSDGPDPLTATFYKMTVNDFILAYSNNPNLPLLIDGTLNVDINASFGTGQWNMGRGSEIVVEDKGLRLSNVNIWSAVNLGVGYAACCDNEYTWLGIRSEGISKIIVSECTISNALVALHYPGLSVINSNFPKLSVINTSLLGNMFALRNENTPLNIIGFSGNFIRGRQDCICTCDVVNALDFRGKNLAVVFPGGETNEILQYEQALHSENTSVTLRNFYIHDLDNYAPITLWPNLSDDNSKIGVYFQNTNDFEGNSALTLENCNFNAIPNNDEVMRVGVKVSLEAGGHTLTAIGDTVTESIIMKKTNNGYAINVENGAQIRGEISANKIYTSDPVNSEGISLEMRSQNNQLNIQNNIIDVNGGTSLSQGIYMGYPPGESAVQKIKAVGNKVSLASNTAEGNAIRVDNCEEVVVKDNFIYSNSQTPCIEVNQGGNSDINCNYVEGGRIGLKIDATWDNNIISNSFFNNFKHGLYANGMCIDTKGSKIALNSFDYNYNESIYYDTICITGPQWHDGYNMFYNQNGDNEVIHDGIEKFVKMCAFHINHASVLGSVTYPAHDPFGVILNNKIKPYTILVFSCSSGTDEPGNKLYMDNVPVYERYADIVSDTALALSVTVAEYGHIKQSVMDLIARNPDWLLSNSVLSDFYAAEQSAFSGKSAEIIGLFRAFQHITGVQQEHLQVLRDSHSVVQTEILSLMATLDTLTNPTAIISTTLLIEDLQQQAAQVMTVLDSLRSVYDTLNTTALTALAAANGSLSASEDFQVWEQDMNNYSIKLLKGEPLDSAELSQIRTVASECYRNGGKAVLDARILAVTCLKEYYSVESCAEPPGGAGMPSQNHEKLYIYPNPVRDLLNIRMGADINASKAELRIYDLTGRLQQAHQTFVNTSTDITIDISGLPEGIYVAELKASDSSFFEKFIIQR